MADDITPTTVEAAAIPGRDNDAGNPAAPDFRFRFAHTIKKGSVRKDHLGSLVETKDASAEFMTCMVFGKPDASEDSVTLRPTTLLTREQKEELIQQSQFIKEIADHTKEFSKLFSDDLFVKVEVKMNNFTYKVKVKEEYNAIRTVYNQSLVHDLWQFIKRVAHGERKAEPKEKVLLDNVSLVFKPGRMYLLLGNPGTGGKEALLKAVAGRLYNSAKSSTEGNIQYNGLSKKAQERSGTFIENCVTYIDKTDFHAPRLTVEETLGFAFDCKAGGTHAPPGATLDMEGKALIQKADSEKWRVSRTLEGLGLMHVADTFVGNAVVRGISGGQRRRVSIGEMMHSFSPVLCGDEISTGLDAAATFDICRTLMYFSQVNGMTCILSLLQPTPETVSLFDDVLLMADGTVLYAGPISDVEPYFESLGYQPPDQMDVADFLQEISTPGGMNLYQAGLDRNGRGMPYSISELAGQFRLSEYFKRIEDELADPWTDLKQPLHGKMARQYRNSVLRAIRLNFSRRILIWRRDKRFLIANAMKNVIMGISVGAVFFQTGNFVSIFGVCFQINLFIMLGAMVAVPAQVDDRIIYYKHSDANFFGAFPYVLGKALGLMPQACIDVMIFGTIIYWMVGFTPAPTNYFLFIAILFTFSAVMNQMLSIFAAFARTKTAVQGLSASVLLFLVLFSGFIVNPDVIPSYYMWIYWWNPLAWTYRALLVNEFQSPPFDHIVEGSNQTEGDLALLSQGFGDNEGKAIGRQWIAFNFAYLGPFFVLCVIMDTLAYMHARVEPNEMRGGCLSSAADTAGDIREEELVIAGQPINLTFQNICYDVLASNGQETIRLLQDVSGIFASTKMVALMGSSGAGKTTLMDVIAMRRNTGTLSGQILINGFPQTRRAFRRVTGYVEQFDVQSPELTVRETILFSARLRLDPKVENMETDESKVHYVDKVLRKLELTRLADCLVGSDEEGGLSFEERKRLSIAVEMAASPSILFLDEPTSGLDARAAAIVIRALRRIADSGRTVIATIHQPSLAVFEMFDELLLLQKGGRTVFFGELGPGCMNVTNYFESLGADLIGVGESPANWMLNVITADGAPRDYAEEFIKSRKYSELNQRIRVSIDDAQPGDEIVFDDEFATTSRQRQSLTNKRFLTIYFRSPAYNLTRIVVSMCIAFILGSVYLSNRHPLDFSETQIGSIFSTVFISFIITGVLAIISVLPVMLKLRDSFYKHRAAGMVGPNSVALALGVAEKWFIVTSSVLFCLIFIGTSGLHFTKFRRLVAFWGFFTFNAAIYSYFGQAFMCLVREMGTAQILASIFIGLNNFFSGLIVRPQYLVGLFQFTYWLTPGHYVYEGMIISLFNEDERLVFAAENSQFFLDQECSVNQTFACNGTVSEYVQSYFGGMFVESHMLMNIGVLTTYLIVARLTTFLALKYFNFTST